MALGAYSKSKENKMRVETLMFTREGACLRTKKGVHLRIYQGKGRVSSNPGSVFGFELHNNKKARSCRNFHGKDTIPTDTTTSNNNKVASRLLHKNTMVSNSANLTTNPNLDSRLGFTRKEIFQFV